MTTNTGISGPDIIRKPKANVVLDATVLSTLMSCARLADFKFNHNLQSIRGKSNSLEAGSIVHKGLEVTYRMIMNGFPRGNAISTGLVAARLYADGCPHCANFQPLCVVDLYKENTDTHTHSEQCELRPKCGHTPDEYPGVQQTPEESEGHIIGVKHCLDTLEQYWDFYKNDYWVTLGVETVEGKILYEDDDLRILWKAKLDWKIDNNQGVYPVDHKTSKQRRLKLKLNNQFMGQCLVTGTRAMIVNNIGFQKTLKPAEKFTREMMSYSSDALLEWQSQTLPHWAYKMLDYQETGYWAPNFTHCENKYGNCQFIDVCGSDRNMREDAIRMNFIKGPVWDPVNSSSREDEI